MRDVLGRTMLVPALRLMRAQMQRIADPVRLRTLAAQLDARLSAGHRDARTEPVVAGTVPAFWVDVKDAREDSVVLYLHGGAFITETPKLHGALLERICGEAHARGLMVTYRLAPEHPYPAALDDCVSAYRWLLAQGYDARRIVVAGDSAGGNLTLALLLRVRDEGLPLPAGAVALSPLADLTFSGDSIQRNDGIDDMFRADMMGDLVPVYLPEPDLRTHAHVSPVFGDFTGLPPLLLIVGSTELLLDDSVRVAQRWPDAELLVWHGMPHVFPAFEFLPEARVATQRIGHFMRVCFASAAAPQAVIDNAERRAPADVEESAVADAAAAAAPAQRPSWTFSPVAWLYLAVAVFAGLLSFTTAEWWKGPANLLREPVLGAAAAVVVVFVLALREPLGWAGAAVCIGATLWLGPGCGLALALFLACREGQRRSD